jgi:2-polyprenyl-6-methoxyphenol hydroxylase-like FAD-dependent oxidoreductase
VIDTDVVVVGAGPTGLMLVTELRLAGVETLVLERQPNPRDTPKAGGLSGQIVELLHFRGLLKRFEAAGNDSIPASRLPFGGLHVDFTQLAVSRMRLLPLPKSEIERLLADRVEELGGEVRRGHEVVAVNQNDASVRVHIAWAISGDERKGNAVPALREALSEWFGKPDWVRASAS